MCRWITNSHIAHRLENRAGTPGAGAGDSARTECCRVIRVIALLAWVDDPVPAIGILEVAGCVAAIIFLWSTGCRIGAGTGTRRAIDERTPGIQALSAIVALLAGVHIPVAAAIEFAGCTASTMAVAIETPFRDEISILIQRILAVTVGNTCHPIGTARIVTLLSRIHDAIPAAGIPAVRPTDSIECIPRPGRGSRTGCKISIRKPPVTLLIIGMREKDLCRIIHSSDAIIIHSTEAGLPIGAVHGDDPVATVLATAGCRTPISGLWIAGLAGGPAAPAHGHRRAPGTCIAAGTAIVALLSGIDPAIPALLRNATEATVALPPITASPAPERRTTLPDGRTVRARRACSIILRTLPTASHVVTRRRSIAIGIASRRLRRTAE
jgi:hypothetical protein